MQTSHAARATATSISQACMFVCPVLEQHKTTKKRMFDGVLQCRVCWAPNARPKTLKRYVFRCASDVLDLSGCLPEKFQGDQRSNGKERSKAATHENDVPDVDLCHAARATAIVLGIHNFSIFAFRPADKNRPRGPNRSGATFFDMRTLSQAAKT